MFKRCVCVCVGFLIFDLNNTLPVGVRWMVLANLIRYASSPLDHHPAGCTVEFFLPHTWVFR